jgi:hypothetical protein
MKPGVTHVLGGDDLGPIRLGNTPKDVADSHVLRPAIHGIEEHLAEQQLLRGQCLLYRPTVCAHADMERKRCGARISSVGAVRLLLSPTCQPLGHLITVFCPAGCNVPFRKGRGGHG